MRFILGSLFKLLGWKVIGNVPSNVKKAIFAVAPHQKTIDFFVGLGVRAALKLDIGFLGKAELFKPPFGFIFRALGGVPVFRTENRNMVDSQIEVLKNMDDRLISLAPEGTRKNVAKLRSGFYYMALGANIPIIRVGFDTENKLVIFGEPFMPSGNFEEDMTKYFVPFFSKIGSKPKDWIKNYREGKFNESL